MESKVCYVRIIYIEPVLLVVSKKPLHFRTNMSIICPDWFCVWVSIYMVYLQYVGILSLVLKTGSIKNKQNTKKEVRY